ncbi:MAG TPA: sugar phosphate isomerase/epimerase family protein [Bryobacteraceae bacterium]|nr:sugar phosphate isomerase/epimerase family protein [Bryobacteraceae bacterium]
MDRRTFLTSVAALAATRLGAAPSTGMFLALNNALIGNKVQWPDSARLAARVGFGGIDLNLNAARKEGLDATRSLLDSLKLRTSFCSLPVNVTGAEDVYQRGLAGLEEVAKFVSGVGCGRMMMVLPAASETPADELRKMLKERLTAVAEILARNDCRLGLEPLGPLMFRTRAPHEFIWKMNDAVAFAKEIGPNIGIVLDSWHWHHSGATTNDIVQAGKSRIVTIHLSDAAKMPPADVKDNQRLLPGEGVIDLVGFFRALKQIGYEDGISPEVLGRIPATMSAEEGAKLGLDASLAVMRKAGIAI